MFKAWIFFSFFSFVNLSSAQSTFQRAQFTDQNLSILLQQSQTNNSSGLIYVWSPRMPLSILGAQELSHIAENLNLPLTLVLDPAVPEQEAQASARENILLLQSPRLASNILIGLHITIHYPSLIIYRQGHLLTPSRPGYDETERVKNYILRRLQ